jgi:hypothetical protein
VEPKKVALPKAPTTAPKDVKLSTAEKSPSKIEKLVTGLPKMPPAWQLVSGLWQAGALYLKTGLIESKKLDGMAVRQRQHALGNMCVGLELMIKAYVASRSPFLVFAKLSPEQSARIAQFLEDTEKFPWERVNALLAGSAARSIGFEEAVQFFEEFFPGEKEKIAADLRILRYARNAAVHFVLPEFHQHELRRAAFVGVAVHDVILAARADHRAFSPGQIDADLRAFVKNYKKDKAAKVQEKLAAAAKKGAQLKGTTFMMVWGDQVREANCVVCGNDGVATGFVDKDHANRVAGIYFDTFECESCGLKLEDSEELEMAGMELWQEIHYESPPGEE